MPVHIDDIPVDIEPSSLGEILLAAQQRVEPDGRIIVEVLLDGEPLIGDALVERQDEALGDSTLSLMTANPRELVVDTLSEIHRQLEAAGEYQTEAADCLQRDDESGALERLGEAMTIWQQTERAVRESAQIMEVSLDDLKIGGQTFGELTTSLIAQLGSLRDLLQSRDTVAVADTLQYEWPQTTMRWQQAVEKLVERIKE